MDAEAYFKFQFLNFLNENRRFYPDFRFSQPLEKMSYADLLAGAFEIKARKQIFLGSVEISIDFSIEISIGQLN